MGWYYTHGASKAQIIAEIERDTRSSTIVERAVRGNHLWHVLKPANAEVEPFIVLYLLSSSKDGWGYKSMSEDMGPYYYTCPTTWFAKYPTSNETARRWREACAREAGKKRDLAAKSKQVAVGDLLKCNGTVFRVEGPYHKRGQFIIVEQNGGRRFRSQRSFIAENRLTREEAEALIAASAPASAP